MNVPQRLLIAGLSLAALLSSPAAPADAGPSSIDADYIRAQRGIAVPKDFQPDPGLAGKEAALQPFYNDMALAEAANPCLETEAPDPIGDATRQAYEAKFKALFPMTANDISNGFVAKNHVEQVFKPTLDKVTPGGRSGDTSAESCQAFFRTKEWQAVQQRYRKR